jgi:hypothetical protein
VIVCYLLPLTTAARDLSAVKNAKNKENTQSPQKPIHRFEITPNPRKLPANSPRPSGRLKKSLVRLVLQKLNRQSLRHLGHLGRFEDGLTRNGEGAASSMVWRY